MEVMSTQLIDEIIFCEKTAISADRKKMGSVNRHKKNTIYLASDDGKYEYKAFLRQSVDFLEDFSVGLIWTNPSKIIEFSKTSIILFRCQGPHDGKAPLGSDIHHDYHTHTITVEDFDQKRYQKPSDRKTTKEFSSFEQAIYYFLTVCKIKKAEDIVEFPEAVTQFGLF